MSSSVTNWCAEAHYYSIINIPDNDLLSPSLLSVYIGSTAAFTCQAFYVERWFQNTDRITAYYTPQPNMKLINNNTQLVITVAEYSNEAVYECMGHKRDLGVFYAVSYLQVKGFDLSSGASSPEHSLLSSSSDDELMDEIISKFEQTYEYFMHTSD